MFHPVYSADSILICSSALYNSIKVSVCYVCTCLCACMCMYACKVCICTEINLMSIYLSGFHTLKVKIFEIPYFEVKDCYKLLNKDICMLFNITKELKLMKIE